jgi:hypothetical protein
MVAAYIFAPTHQTFFCYQFTVMNRSTRYRIRAPSCICAVRDLVQSKHSSRLSYANAGLAAPQASNGEFAAANLKVTLHCQKYSDVVPLAIGEPL